MCIECWRSAGSPAIINDSTINAARLIGDIYDSDDTSGNCHVVLSDWNLSDDSIDWTINEAIAENFCGCSSEQLAIERDCMNALRALSLNERFSAMAIAEGAISLATPQDLING